MRRFLSISLVLGMLMPSALYSRWVKPNGPSGSPLMVFAVSGTNIFAGTQGPPGVQGRGVFVSTNNGTSWTAVNSGLTNTDVRALAVSGTNLFAGTGGGGVYLSTNNGTSWSAAGTDLTCISFCGLTNPDVCALAVDLPLNSPQ